MALPGTALSSAVSAGRGLAADSAGLPHFGLSMLFTVSVADLGTLGQWTSCEGLRVDFRFDKIRSGGEYAHEYIVPNGISYPPVTLRRGMDAASSKRVRTWLRSVASLWELWDGEAEQYPGTTVTISLHDVYKLPAAPVAVWSLHGAYPVSWAGPTLNARTNEVAVETLVIEHQGFLTEPLP